MRLCEHADFTAIISEAAASTGLDEPLSPPVLPTGSFYKLIRPGVLQANQFPVNMSDAQGNFHKPPSW